MACDKFLDLFVKLSINIWNKPTTPLIFVAEAELQTSRYLKVICYQLIARKITCQRFN